MSERSLVSVVVPVFNEREVIDTFYERATGALESIDRVDHELLFVDDGSSDGSYERLVELANSDPRVRIVKFSRNFGHQIAITAGLDHAQCDCAVVIDSDLQDPPEVIGEMVDTWRKGFEVVYGVRARRDGEGALKLLQARPVTSYVPLVAPLQTPPGQPRHLYMDGALTDGLTISGPISPLTLDAFEWVYSCSLFFPFSLGGVRAGRKGFKLDLSLPSQVVGQEARAHPHDLARFGFAAIARSSASVVMP